MENEYAIQLQNNTAISFVPSGNSMWPFLKNKNQAVIIERKTKRLKVYDVALFYRDNGQTVLHRVKKVLKGGYVMQGDSQNYTENVKEENVIGLMTGFYKGKKFISVNDKRYIRKVKSWVESKYKKKIFCKIFYKTLSLKNKLKGLKNV